MVECPVCGVKINVSESAEKGEMLQCKDCGTELEVTNKNPIEIKVAPEVEEDWGE